MPTHVQRGYPLASRSPFPIPAVGDFLFEYNGLPVVYLPSFMPRTAKPQAILWVFLALALASLLARCWVHLVSHNYNISAEANGLYGVLEVGDGRPLYLSRGERPYAVHLYPPVYGYVCGSLLRFFGPEALHSRVVMVRAFSFFCLVGLVGLLVVIFLKKKRLSFFVLSLTGVFTLSKFADYATAGRNDMLSLALDVGAIALYLAERRSRKGMGGIYLAGFLVLSVLSFYTRQTGIAVFGAVVLWTLSLRQYRRCFLLVLGYVGLGAAVFAGLNQATRGAFFEQVFLANLRGFRQLDNQFFDASMIGFLLSYVIFFGLVIRGVRLSKAAKDPEWKLLGLCSVLSFFLSAAVFLRAGGDVNYFFESILFGGIFVALACQSFFENFRGTLRDWSIAGAMIFQLTFITGFYAEKTLYAYRVAFLPYEALATRAKSELAPFGYLIGTGAQNMGIHLRGWALYGPDVTNSGYVAKNAHLRFRSLIKDLLKDVIGHRVHSMVMVDPECGRPYKRLRGTYAGYFPVSEAWEPWFCVYREAKVSNALTER
jgi:hypothetical protein